MSYFAELAQELSYYLDAETIQKIYQAYKLAKKAHAGQKRRSGEPYITHPVAAAVILAELRMDSQSIKATLLHDTIEDTKVSKEELREQFGEEVADLVDGVSKLTQMKFESRAQAQAENFRKMVLAMVRDIRVILVKLADRLHNMRTLGVMPLEKKRRIANETLEIYAPIANRLGMHSLYIELEDLGFAALYPMRFRAVSQAVKKARGNRQELMDKIEQGIREALNKHEVPYSALYGRQKHLYSIYKKMRGKSASFAEIMDVYGFRIITPNIDACYQTLGVVHRTYKPVPERFKDYIAIPKSNGYQSLHTTLFGPFGVPIEVQIRTEEMDRVAINGIAAHWLYKRSGLETSEAQTRAREWVRKLLELQTDTGSSLEFIENVKIDLFPDEVYVFTPSGDIMELPKGATPVDFAYAVHSDLGNTCVAAKVNRRLAPLSQPLVNGQTVEILIVKGATPNIAWLNFVVTGKARSNIRHFIKEQQTQEAVVLGKRLLEKSLSDLSCNLAKIPEESIKLLLQERDYENLDDLYAAIGLGNQLALVIAQKLLGQQAMKPCTESSAFALAITGTEGMVVRYADCCHPIPGDPIAGCLQPGRGVLVHLEHCPEVAKFRSHPGQFIHMRWEDEVEGEFSTTVTLEVRNERGVLGRLANAIAEEHSNIEDIFAETNEAGHNLIHFTLSVNNRQHLANIIRRLKQIPMVVNIARDKL